MRERQAKHGQLHLVSVGPGLPDVIAPRAMAALARSEAVVGYELYLTWIRDRIEGKQIWTFPLTQERTRADKALELARAGQTVSLVSSGDVGIYAMAPLVFELMHENEPFELEIIPGISAANASAALLGAPLAHDFATLSLSDRLCSWDWIRQRALKLAEADLVVALYNVQSRGRPDGIYEILDLFREHKGGSTWCGVVRDGYREGQARNLCPLSELSRQRFDMRTTLIIGNKHTSKKGEFIYTPRGYTGWGAALEKAESLTVAGRESVWVFSGTSDGNELARYLSEAGHDVVLSSASTYGMETARRLLPDLTHITGGEGDAKRRVAMRKHRARAIVDATHPFAARISQKLIDLSKEFEIPYLRFERAGAGPYPEATYVETIEEAARRAMNIGRRIFLATGSKWVREILGLEGARAKAWFVRILPYAKALNEALDAGLPYDRICAMQGGGGKELNKALWRQWQIDCVVTRDSGGAGGLDAKAGACREMEIPLVVVKRPRLDYPWVASEFQPILDFLEADGDDCQTPASTYVDPASAKNLLYPDGKN